MKDNSYDNTIINRYIGAIKKYNLLTPEEEVDLAKKVASGSKLAKEKLINSNLRLVIKIAKNYTNMEPSLIDLIQEGNLGLIRAAEKFEYKMGCRFSTYASYWIKHYITRFIAKRSRVIRIPIRKGDMFKKIVRLREEFMSANGSEPSNSIIADYLGVDERSVSEILEIFRPTVSLEQPMNDEDFTLYDVVGDNDRYNPEIRINREEIRMQMEGALDSLVDNEKNILKMRYGFSDNKPVSLKDIGDKYGVSAETVRQIENRAKKKIENNHAYLKEYVV
ncbi:MAG: RNA polymerase sigma factor RpoD/SigA [Spirochaetes bacterium]|nr:RNA polymerase sigma factor RpoD/SigA [Spirochaetota bacterium]